jgi:hypothetical protein
MSIEGNLNRHWGLFPNGLPGVDESSVLDTATAQSPHCLRLRAVADPPVIKLGTPVTELVPPWSSRP